MVKVIQFLFLSLLAVSNFAYAVDMSVRPREDEWKKLPDFCEAKYKLKQGSPEWNSWRDRIGHNFIDIHHYCIALNSINRYWESRTKMDRDFMLNRAIDNYNYMVKAEKPDFLYRADVYVGRGEAYMLMGRNGEAVMDFNKALSINPKLLKAYLHLANIQKTGKNMDKALATVTEGLRHIPDSKALRRRYIQLGGKEPFPEPYAARQKQEIAEQQKSSVIEPLPRSVKADNSTTGQSEHTGADSSARSIGTQGNPYCRFCPAE